jgi:nucleoside 2-deoxyribosyltransferase
MSKSFNPALSVVAAAFASGVRSNNAKPGAPNPTAARRPIVFLADNSRLVPNAKAERQQADAVCRSFGLAPEWPSEHALFPDGLTMKQREQVGLPTEDQTLGKLLGRAWRKIGACDALIAETTPFRGDHLNPVIAFEIGVAAVQDIPVFAWTAATRPASPFAPPNLKKPRRLIDRIWCGDEIQPDGYWRDESGILVENFEMVEYAQIAANFISVSTSKSDAIRDCAEFLGGKREPARKRG